MNRSLLNTSPAELIALATGRRGSAAHADAHRLVKKLGLKKLADAGTAEIQEICRGMTPNAVQRLMAGVEIGLRIAELKSEYESSPRITSPASAIQFCREHFGRMARENKQEEFWMVTLIPRTNRSTDIRLLSDLSGTVWYIQGKCFDRPFGMQPIAFLCCTTFTAVIPHPAIRTSA